MAAAKQLTVNFELERETKNTVRYAEQGDNPVVGTLYVKKSAAAKLGNPEKMAVTLKAS
jgi:hypothetical protein